MTLSRALNVTVTTVIAGQVNIRTNRKQTDIEGTFYLESDSTVQLQSEAAHHKTQYADGAWSPHRLAAVEGNRNPGALGSSWKLEK